MLFTPLIWIVYGPDVRFTICAESPLLAEKAKAPTCAAVLAISAGSALVPHPVLEAIIVAPLKTPSVV